MKKFLLFLAVSAAIVSCNRLADNEFEIAGTVDKSLDGKNVILEKNGGFMGIIPVDTVKIENGKFIFKGTVTEPSLHFIQVEGVQGKGEIILENGEIEIAIDKDTIQKTTQGGTYNNDKLHEFYGEIKKTQKKMIAFQKKNQEVMMAAYKSNDTVVMNRLNKEYMVLGKEMEGVSVKFLEKNPKAYISLLILKQLANMGKTPMDKINKYYDSLDPETRKLKEAEELAEMLGKGKKKEGAPATTTEAGKPAPRFSAPDMDGKQVSLKQAMGKVTIIDFWASWCKPCRIENPNVVALYGELHDKGLNIIGVSLDKDANKWKGAIVEDQLGWTQVSNLKSWDEPVALQYGVKSIPATFILDANGVIVGKDLRGDALRTKVKELLGVK